MKLLRTKTLQRWLNEAKYKGTSEGYKLGYMMGEIEGRNRSLIVPQPKSKAVIQAEEYLRGL